MIISILIMFSGCSNTTYDAKEEKKLKIGIIAPLSGEYAFLGTDVIDSLKLRDDINNYEIIYEDDESCNAKAGINAGNKLIYNDEVDVLITSCSNSAQGLYEITKSKNITHIQLSEGLIYEKDHFYQIMPFSFDLYEDLGEFVSNKYHSICIINEQNEVYTGNIEYFKKGISKGNATIVSENIVNSKSKDFKSELLKCNNANSDAVLPLLFPESKSILFKQLDDLQYNIDIIAEPNDEFGLGSYGEYLEGAEFITFDMKGLSSFKDQFNQVYGRNPQFTAVFAYDAIDLIDEFMQRKINFTYNGVFGKYEFDENGNSHAQTYVARIENNSVKIIREFNG